MHSSTHEGHTQSTTPKLYMSTCMALEPSFVYMLHVQGLYRLKEQLVCPKNMCGKCMLPQGTQPIEQPQHVDYMNTMRIALKMVKVCHTGAPTFSLQRVPMSISGAAYAKVPQGARPVAR